MNVVASSPITGGYVLVRAAAPPPGNRSVPAEIITISDCIQDKLPRPDHWDWFQDLAEAHHAQSMCADAQLVAVGLKPDEASRLIENMGGPEQPWFALLGRKEPAAGTLLGYELLGAEDSLDFHSWHCHSYADDLASATGISLNGFGLFSNMADARAALEWMTSLPSEEAPAPVPWCVAALTAAPSAWDQRDARPSG
ncbi:hypothetical protein KUV85_11045 [Nocardioides panacisoli]|uniref:hypothetical protein n=1 Tax=Nocardioides panacisoli TaxID=627624 RepID=UPI001C6304E8|nr:hypothetical protein [Nocardioides panacisoli]QYJ02870.1 hypothetical protein KUV85_11045 [Nocardioides panacisoli]